MDEASFEEWGRWMILNWKQGEHVAVAGPTGCGKSTLVKRILSIRDFVVVIAVKAHDDIVDQFEAAGYDVIDKAKDIVIDYPLPRPDRLVLNLHARKLGKDKDQTIEIKKSLESLYQAGGYCIFADDLGRITGKLKLQEEITTLMSEGRSSYVSMVVAMTQPKSASARVPSESFRQCQHTILFGYTDTTSQKMCADLAGVPVRQFTNLVPSLGKHNFLYVGNGIKTLIRNGGRHEQS